MFLNYVTVCYIYFFFLQLYYLGFKYILILLKGIIMIIKTYLKMTPSDRLHTASTFSSSRSFFFIFFIFYFFFFRIC